MDQELNKQTLLLIEKLDQLKEMFKEKYVHPDVINRIEKLESHYYSDGDLSAIHGCIRNLEKNADFDEHQRKRLEEKFHDLEQLFYDEKAKFRNPEKKPHKCPICDGNGKYISVDIQSKMSTISVEIDALGRHWVKCHICQGKGIIWD